MPAESNLQLSRAGDSSVIQMRLSGHLPCKSVISFNAAPASGLYKCIPTISIWSKHPPQLSLKVGSQSPFALARQARWIASKGAWRQRLVRGCVQLLLRLSMGWRLARNNLAHWTARGMEVGRIGGSVGRGWYLSDPWQWGSGLRWLQAWLLQDRLNRYRSYPSHSMGQARSRLRAEMALSVLYLILGIEACILQSLMPCEVRVFQVALGQPEFLGAPVLNTVLRKPGLQVPFVLRLGAAIAPAAKRRSK